MTTPMTWDQKLEIILIKLKVCPNSYDPDIAELNDYETGYNQALEDVKSALARGEV